MPRNMDMSNIFENKKPSPQGEALKNLTKIKKTGDKYVACKRMERF